MFVIQLDLFKKSFVLHINALSTALFLLLSFLLTLTSFPLLGRTSLRVCVYVCEWSLGALKQPGFLWSVGGLLVSTEPWSDGSRPLRDSASGAQHHISAMWEHLYSSIKTVICQIFCHFYHMTLKMLVRKSCKTGHSWSELLSNIGLSVCLVQVIYHLIPRAIFSIEIFSIRNFF